MGIGTHPHPSTRLKPDGTTRLKPVPHPASPKRMPSIVAKARASVVMDYFLLSVSPATPSPAPGPFITPAR
jgi:hypothetical protein